MQHLHSTGGGDNHSYRPNDHCNPRNYNFETYLCHPLISEPAPPTISDNRYAHSPYACDHCNVFSSPRAIIKKKSPRLLLQLFTMKQLWSRDDNSGLHCTSDIKEGSFVMRFQLYILFPRLGQVKTTSYQYGRSINRVIIGMGDCQRHIVINQYIKWSIHLM